MNGMIKLLLPYFSRTVKRILCFSIAVEFVFAGLGFCGHQHDHSSHGDGHSQESAFSSADTASYHFHAHSEDSDCCQNRAESTGNSHCSCLGGVVATLPIVSDRIILELNPTNTNRDPIYYYHYSATLFRPPIQDI